MADKKIVGTSPKKILESEVLQMPFPVFSRNISHQKRQSQLLAKNLF